MQRLCRKRHLPYPATRCSGVLSAEALAAAFPSHGAPESDEHTALSGAARYAEARLGAA